jgi:hypothetical protein
MGFSLLYNYPEALRRSARGHRPQEHYLSFGFDLAFCAPSWEDSDDELGDSRDPELERFWFGELTRACQSCHARHAAARFPAHWYRVPEQISGINIDVGSRAYDRRGRERH